MHVSYVTWMDVCNENAVSQLFVHDIKIFSIAGMVVRLIEILSRIQLVMDSRYDPCMMIRLNLGTIRWDP